MMARPRTIPPLLLLTWLAVGCTAEAAAPEVVDAGPPVSSAADGLLSEVVLVVKVKGKGEDVRVEVPLPSNGEHQEILHEELRLRGFAYEEQVRNGNRLAILTWPKLEGRKRFTWKGLVRTREVHHDVPPVSPDVTYDPSLRRWTMPTPRLQSRSPAVRERLIRHVEPRLGDGERDLLKMIYRLVSREFERRSGKAGTSIALKALRTGMADDLGLDRLLVTFLRTAGIPARNVGGVRLHRDGEKRFARWTEVFVDGKWLPFSAPEDWYGVLPGPYLKFYHGDRKFIRRQGLDRVAFKVLVSDPPPPAAVAQREETP